MIEALEQKWYGFRFKTNFVWSFDSKNPFLLDTRW